MRNLHLNIILLLFSIFILFSSSAFTHKRTVFPHKRTIFPPSYTSPFNYSQKTILFALENKKRASIEGIYECKPNNKREHHKIAILKNNPNGYSVLFFSGSSSYLDWVPGEQIGFLPISSESRVNSECIYSYLDWYLSNKQLNKSAQIAFSEKGKSNIRVSFSDNTSPLLYTKEDFEVEMSDISTIKKTATISSGTGFALAKNGYIGTNRHVINKGKTFKVIQYEAGIPIEYKAVLVYSDPNNDIAILKIKDPKFEGFDDIPYSISSSPVEQGFSVYTLGHPLVKILGTEQKLRSGLISSPIGYQNNKKTYATDIELLPGNSGGPLFDAYGNLQGIVYSRFSEYNNLTYTVGYAIKSTVLLESIQKSHLPIQLPRGNKIMHLPLTEQVKKLKPFIFRIGVYK